MAQRALSTSAPTMCSDAADVADDHDNTANMEKMTTELLRKEKSVQHGFGFLERTYSILKQHRKLFPEFQQWIEEIGMGLYPCVGSAELINIF